MRVGLGDLPAVLTPKFDYLAEMPRKAAAIALIQERPNSLRTHRNEKILSVS